MKIFKFKKYDDFISSKFQNHLTKFFFKRLPSILISLVAIVLVVSTNFLSIWTIICGIFAYWLISIALTKKI